ncbi:MAG: pyruvate dehydrogenase E2 component (dihydrolipoamide acetyltransferase), partial [Dinoroseobacter sp.]
MPTEILMPALSPTMEEGTLAKWLVKEGDTVSSGDLLAEIETDKATMEFEAVDEGVIGKILIAEGTEGVKVNVAIAILLEEGESADDIAATSAPAVAPAAAVSAAAVPTADAPAPAAPAASDGTRLFASPLARRIAADKGLDLSLIKGSGPHGRIVRADVENATVAPKAAAPTAAAAAPVTAAPTGPSPDAIAKMYEGRETEDVKLDGMRKIIAARLTEAKQTVPHFYLRRDIELDALMKFRAQLNKTLEPRGIKLSVNDFIIKACALALQQYPDANAVWAGDRMIKMKASDVAVAVAIEGGLFTPVLQDAEMKSLSALSAQMKDLAARARDRKLAP